MASVSAMRPSAQGGDHRGDRHVDPMRCGQRTTARAVATPSTVTCAGQSLALPKRQPKRKLRDCVRGAGQHQIAKARQAGQRFGPRAKRQARRTISA
jgi:hypothetical protein